MKEVLYSSFLFYTPKLELELAISFVSYLRYHHEKVCYWYHMSLLLHYRISAQSSWANGKYFSFYTRLLYLQSISS